MLEVRYRGKNIHEALDLTVKEALQFFANVPKIVEKLRVLEEVGLGYLRLGQSATTLSGGEAQRMKLAAHLQPAAREASRLRSADGSSRRRQHLLYIFDEPTTGLHFDDISKLLSAFRRLIDAGGSILVIEHNLEVIKTADWVIDLGPEGGARRLHCGSGAAGGDRQAAEFSHRKISGECVERTWAIGQRIVEAWQVSVLVLLCLLLLGLLARWNRSGSEFRSNRASSQSS